MSSGAQLIAAVDTGPVCAERVWRCNPVLPGLPRKFITRDFGLVELAIGYSVVEVNRAASHPGPKGLTYSVLGRLSRVRDKFGLEASRSKQNRRGHPASFSPTRSHKQEP